MKRNGFTLIELLVVIVIIGILVAIALPNFIKIKDKAKEAEVKQNCHAIQLGLERYAVDAPGSNYPYIIMGGDWTDSYVVWQQWVDTQVNLDPSMITNPARRDGWLAADTDAGDPLVMESYLPSYPGNPFLKSGADTLLPRIHHFPSAFHPNVPPFWRIVGGRESNKMFEVFGPVWLIAGQSIAGYMYVHHIFFNPKYNFEGDMYKDPPNGWSGASGNNFLTGNFSYWPRGERNTAWGITGASDAMGYTLAGYGSVRTKGQDVYNRNGNYKGRYRTETCEMDCAGSGVLPDDIPCICDGEGAPSVDRNNGGSDTIQDGVVVTLDSGLDKKSSRVNVDITEGEGQR